MPARSGTQYLTGLRENAAEVWLGNERIQDVTSHLALKRGHVVGDDEDVMDIEATAGVIQDADKILEINALVGIEELVRVHLERIKDEGHLIFRAHSIGNPERVVIGRILGMLRVNQAKLARPTSCVYGRQEALEKLLIAFAVDENDRAAARNILLRKRFQQG